jgi:tetratricopeptide (TPR) repeat protein
LAAALAMPAGGEPPSDADKDKGLRDARALLRAGSQDAAIAQLERLNAIYPNDAAVVGPLFQVLLDTKRYDRAEAVIGQFLAARPGDPKGLCDLAMVYLVTDRKAGAIERLNALVASAPDEAWPYQMAYETLWRHGDNEDAIGFISQGRRAVGEPALFAAAAARIHRAANAFGEAAREYVLAGVGQQDPEAAVDGVMQMSENAEAREAIVLALDQAAAEPDLERVARACLWQVHLTSGACDLAFQQISALAGTGNLTPEILSLFAARSRAKACYRQCSEAYDLAMALPASQAQLPMLMLNKAGCELSGGLAAEAALTYAEVMKKYHDTQWACEAGVALGRVLSDQGRLPEAVAEADKVISSRAAGDARFDAILFKGDCLVRMGNLEEAFTTYDLVSTDWKPRYAQEAFYNLGEIKFYEAKFDEATSYYNVALRQYPDEPRANDSIERLLAVKAVRGGLGTAWLADFARAKLLQRQGRTDEAVPVLTQLAADPGQGVIKTESIRALSEIYAERGEFDRAVKLYRLAGDTLSTYFSAPALEAIGDLYLGLGKTAEAIQAYEDVILKFPESVSAGDARRKIEGARRQSQ